MLLEPIPWCLFLVCLSDFFPPESPLDTGSSQTTSQTQDKWLTEMPISISKRTLLPGSPSILQSLLVREYDWHTLSLTLNFSSPRAATALPYITQPFWLLGLSVYSSPSWPLSLAPPLISLPSQSGLLWTLPDVLASG